MNALLFLLAVASLMHAARSFSPSSERLVPAGALAFGFLLLAAFYSGRLFAHLRLPRLTGYIVCGIVFGPSLLGLLTREMVDALAPVKGVAVCLIALTAGGELNFRRMRALLGTIRSITLWTISASVALTIAALLALRPWIPFLAALPISHAIIASIVVAVAVSAMSPAVVMAIFAEVAPSGPVSRTILGVVIVADFAVIVLFAAVSSIAQGFWGDRVDVGGTALHLAWEVFGSIAAGAVIGVVLTIYLRTIREGRALFVLLLCVVASEVGGRIALDPLIIMLATGLFIENVTEIEASALVHEIEAASLPVYLVFFGLAGAMLHLQLLAKVALPAVVLVVTRALGMWIGSRIATRRTGAPDSVMRWSFAGFLPQAGLALALALLLPSIFPDFGDAAAALVIGVVGLNELLMPIVLRHALVKSGEATVFNAGSATNAERSLERRAES